MKKLLFGIAVLLISESYPSNLLFLLPKDMASTLKVEEGE
jgi:hypothetical protein